MRVETRWVEEIGVVVSVTRRGSDVEAWELEERRFMCDGKICLREGWEIDLRVRRAVILRR